MKDTIFLIPHTKITLDRACQSGQAQIGRKRLTAASREKLIKRQRDIDILTLGRVGDRDTMMGSRFLFLFSNYYGMW